MKRELFIAVWALWLGMTTAWSQSNFPPTGFITPTGLQTPMTVGSGVQIISTISATAPVSYQWQFNGVDLPGQTGTNLLILNAQTNHSGGYRLVATNAFGSFTSAVAELSFFHALPKVQLFPRIDPFSGFSSTPAIVGSQFLLFAITEGGPRPSVQWQWNGTNLPGQTNVALLITNAQTNQSGGYSAVASNAFGIVTSAVSVITIVEPVPVLAYFATGVPPLALGRHQYLDATITLAEPATLQWRFHGTNLLSATNRSLRFSPLQPTDAGEYDLVATTASGSYTSPPIQLTVWLQPPSGAVPGSVYGRADVLVGEDVSLFTSFEGSPCFVQWRFNGVNLPGQTNQNLNLLGVSTNQAGNYSFIATNLAGATTSSVVTLRVRHQVPVDVTPLTAQSVIEGGTVLFEAYSQAGPPPAYFLERHGTNVAAPLTYKPHYDTNYSFLGYSAVFSLIDATFADAGNYRIIASNFLGSVTSTVGTLTVSPAGPLDRWTQRNPLPQSHALLAVAQGANQFVAVGDRGTILTSPDGANWTLQNRRVDQSLTGVAYGGGQFIAVGAGGTVLSSTDGTNWAYRATFPGTFLNAVAHGQGRFVAVGNHIGLGTLIQHSSDGIQWERISPGLPYGLNAVAYGNGVFVAAGVASIMRSTDGTNWSLVKPVAKEVESITYAGGYFVAVGDDSSILVSHDGALWLPRPELTSRRLLGVTHGAGRFVAAGARGIMLTSTDALNWSTVNSGTPDRLEGIHHAAGRFVALGENGTIITSTNGLDWTKRNFGVTRDLDGMFATDDLVVIVGKGGVILTSTDGVSFTPQDVGLTNDLHGVTWGGGLWIAVGEPGVLLTSPDAVHWTIRETGTMNSLKDVTHAPGQWLAVGTGGTILRSTNGVNWTVQSYGFDLNAVAYGNGVFLIAADGPLGQNGSLLRSFDGMTWSYADFNPGFQPGANLRGLTFAEGQFLIAGNDGLTLLTTDGLGFGYGGTIPLQNYYFENLRAAARIPGEWIVVGNTGVIATSPQGYAWSRRASRTFENLHAVRLFKGRLLAIGNRGTVLQSGRVLTEIGPPEFLAGTGFRVPFQGVIGRTYQVQASTNLVNWTQLATFTNTAAQAAFTDTNALHLPRRFYRLVEP